MININYITYLVLATCSSTFLGSVNFCFTSDLRVDDPE